ncbi:MAG: type II secretion system GspH family protein [Oscillospiraceae bacterium]|nr:type II secretion system GspH family protein [Oscillospiraceae bacterium]
MRKTRSKSVLFLMELTIVILLFSISAAICMMIFAQAKQMSINSRDLTGAIMHLQSAAEIYKATGGDRNETSRLLGGEVVGGDISVKYSENWSPAAAEPTYELKMTKAADGSALFAVIRAGSAESVYELSVRIPGGEQR